jgi:branched-chain amino acid transport system ATP-binding protein
MALLEVHELTKRFGGLVANDRVSLHVDEGEIVGLIGPNGAGKTTLFSCISGTERATSGQVLFEGRDVVGRSPEEICRRGIARTFQIVRTFREMTVLDNVMVGSLLRAPDTRRARAEALEVLDFTGLTAKRDTLGAGLTIAERKRVELARALATGPKLLMLDEAMAGLNPRERHEAVDLVRRAHARGVTILMVEHVMEVIMPISDRVVVLTSGRKLLEDRPEVVARDEAVIKAYLGERYRAAREGPAGC